MYDGLLTILLIHYRFVITLDNDNELFRRLFIIKGSLPLGRETPCDNENLTA